MLHGQYYLNRPLAYNGPRRTSREERPGLLRREQMQSEADRAYDPTCDAEYEDEDDDGYYDDNYDNDNYDDEVNDAHSMVLHDHTKIGA